MTFDVRNVKVTFHKKKNNLKNDLPLNNKLKESLILQFCNIMQTSELQFLQRLQFYFA